MVPIFFLITRILTNFLSIKKKQPKQLKTPFKKQLKLDKSQKNNKCIQKDHFPVISRRGKFTEPNDWNRHFKHEMANVFGFQHNRMQNIWIFVVR